MKTAGKKAKYDSTEDTMMHIEQVEDLIDEVVEQLEKRAKHHDITKFSKEEKPAFDIYTPLLKGTVYGSDEYKNYLNKMKPALDHHYAENAHHPEHHANGIKDMTLIDIMEMLADWKASTLRHETGDLLISINQNQKRFGYGEEMRTLLMNTARAMDWI